MLEAHLSEYVMLDGSNKTLVKRIDDGSIIKRFDMTPLPSKESDIVCPHFLELKWATGCPFDCAWCYLKGTMRHYFRKKNPTYKSRGKIEWHLQRFLRVSYPDQKEVLNTGEIADSLMSETTNAPFSKFIIPLFETQDRHKVLFLTKSDRVDNLLSTNSHNQAIISFSLNSEIVANYEYFLFLTTHNPILSATPYGVRTGSAVAHPEGKHIAVAPFWDMEHILREIGHMMGLEHCEDVSCIMYESHLRNRSNLCEQHRKEVPISGK